MLPPAFDVVATATNWEHDFMEQVHLFKVRISLSILYYLVKVGMGDSEHFFKIMVDAEKNMASIL